MTWCAEALEKEPGTDMETEESDPFTEYTEELVEEIRSDLETEAKEPPYDPGIDWEKRATEPSTRGAIKRLTAVGWLQG